jgi:methyl-accepting chemotaxis protein
MREEINRTGIRLYFWGFVISLGYTYLIGLTMQFLVYRFSAHVFFYTGTIAIILNGLVFFPFIVWSLRHRFVSLRKSALEWEGYDDPAAKAELAEKIRADAERYPLEMSYLACIIATYFYIFIGVTWYILEEIPGLIILNFCIMGVAIGISNGYLEYFITYYLLRPVRRRFYPDLLGGKELRGATLVARIVALVVLMVVMSMILCATTAVVRTAYATQDDIMVRCEQYAEELAESVSTHMSEGMSEEAALHEAAGGGEFEEEWVAIVNFNAGGIYVAASAGNLDKAEIETGFFEDAAEEASASEAGSFLGPWGRQAGAFVPIAGSEDDVLVAVSMAPYMVEASSIGYIFVMVSLIIGLVLAVLAWVTVRTFSQPMSALVEMTSRVGEGNLAVEVPLESSDEIGKLAFAFHHMLDGLRRMIASSLHASVRLSGEAEGTAASSEEVNASLEQLTSIAQELSLNAALQNDKVEEIARMTGEMMNAIEKNYEEATWGSEISQTTSELSAEGRQDASSAVERMETVQGIILEAAESIKVLGTKTVEIFNIVDVIKKISDQTNLLSLNAAIEAAKAHEFGKGFGVVADEVRKLAAESAAASDRIAGLARQIQADSEGSVEYMEKSNREMATGMEAVRQTGKTLENIYDSALKTSELSAAIASATQQTSETSNAVMNALAEIRSIAENNAASSQEIAASIEEQGSSMQEVVAASQVLADLAEQLHENPRRFQTE